VPHCRSDPPRNVPLQDQAEEKSRRAGGKPNSVPPSPRLRRTSPPLPRLSGAAIYLGTSVAGRLVRPTRDSSCAGRAKSPLFGLAPGGVYRAPRVTTRAVRSYRTVSPLPVPPSPRLRRTVPAWPRLERSSAVCSLWHFPWPCGRWALPTTVPCGVRTFLPAPKDRAAASPARRTPSILYASRPGLARLSCSAGWGGV